jgi:hypothetical protein
VQFYDRLFSELSWRPKLDGLIFDSIDEEASWLERPFEGSGVHEMVKCKNSEKTPGPEGLTMALFQVYKYVIKAAIMGLFHDFYASSKFEKSLNITFIASFQRNSRLLILRTFDLLVLSRVYKIIAKVLTNRLRKVVEKILSQPQNAFVRGKQILDSVLIAGKCLDSRIRFDKPKVLCKLDTKKVKSIGSSYYTC